MLIERSGFQLYTQVGAGRELARIRREAGFKQPTRGPLGPHFARLIGETGMLAASFGVGEISFVEVSQISLIEQIGIRFKTLPAGTFRFQGVDGVAFKGCQMAETPLTNGQFRELLVLKPSELAKIVANPQARLEKSLSAVDPNHRDEAEDCPMVYLNATEFAALLEVRLPNEIEWERAAAGTTGRVYSFGDEFDSSKATFDGQGTRSVYAHKDAATPEGILDLSGNIWEWGSNYHGDIDLSDPSIPKLPESGTYRALRGGSWCSDSPDFLQAAYRDDDRPGIQDDCIGGRFAKD
jgi:formylglycine-generating enzyme required for sulfatase activity